MNRDDLILKYIDGELTPEEDAVLRKLLSEDSGAKEAFDTDVLLIAAMKDDARNIKAPVSLVEATEDKIMMKILANTPVQQDKVFSFRRSYAFAAVFALLIITGVFQIHDYKDYINRSGLATALNDIKRNLITGNLAGSDSFGGETPIVISYSSDDGLTSKKVKPNSVGNTGNLAVIITEPVKSVNSLVANAFNDDSRLVSTNLILPLIASDNTANGIPEGLITDFVTNSESSFLQSIDNIENNSLNPVHKPANHFNSITADLSGGNLSSINPYDLYTGIKEIQLSSFFGTDLVRNGISSNKNEMISHFSQSVGYLIDDNQKFGLEFGYTQYTYDFVQIGRIPVGGAPPNKGKDDDLQQSDVLNPSSGDGQYIEFPFTVNRNKQMFWGAAFYEHSLINSNKFSILGRVGFGGSNEGPLGFGRLFAKYDLIKGFSITVGADARFFTSDFSGNDNDSKWKSTGTLIYGFQIKF